MKIPGRGARQIGQRVNFGMEPKMEMDLHQTVDGRWLVAANTCLVVCTVVDGMKDLKEE